MSLENEAAAARSQDILEAENFIDTYKTIAEWIRFADAKAAVTLTVNGVLLGLLVPTLKAYLADAAAVHPTAWWTPLVVSLFVFWLGLFGVSSICAFLCILPFRGEQRRLALDKTSHFHPVAVAQHYPLAHHDRFVQDCVKIGSGGFKQEILTAILIDSHLSNAKYTLVTRSIWFLAASVAVGFAYLLAIQF